MNTETINAIERNINIVYRWWRDDDQEIRPKHVEALEETAEERIFEQLARGCRSGELFDSIRIDDEDPQDGQEYTGWFEINYDNQ
jgi:hypothetical protein